jgi:hypothetical protein
MRFFIFKSESHNELRAFAGDSVGERLPTHLGPWHAIGVVRPDKDPPHNLNRATIEQAIEGQGFQLFRYKTKKAAAG